MKKKKHIRQADIQSTADRSMLARNDEVSDTTGDEQRDDVGKIKKK